MHIKEVILDGFKSYATKTVISGFDPRFNAITGLNGSGKSNILDSICFVLGITQLSQVRVSSLQGLVYKNGQAGITRASVSIVFDNRDKKQAPFGYEQVEEIIITRTIIIGGKNKYQINGRTAQANQVQNLFHSVQLNVNNPHFLIMQGRITKVLNMKPSEILGMIEEAAGTRMYETKKKMAQKKMQQKQVKVDEIEKLLKEEITPKLEKLREEKKIFLTYTCNQDELERTGKFCIAYDFFQKEQMVERSEDELKSLTTEVQTLSTEIHEAEAKKEDVSSEVTALKSGERSEIEKEITRIATEEEVLGKELVKISSQFENKGKEMKRTEKKTKELTKRKATLQKSLTKLEQEVEAYEDQYATGRTDLEQAKKQHQLCVDNLQAANSGMQVNKDDDTQKSLTLTESMTQAKNTLATLKSTMKQNDLKVTHATKELKQLNKLLKTLGKQDETAGKKVEKLRAAKTKIEEDIHGAYGKAEVQAADLNDRAAILPVIRKRIEELQTVKNECENDIGAEKSQYGRLSAKLASLKFGFNRKRVKFQASEVKGFVYRLLTLQDASWATAIEAVAGNKLLQVVVSTEAVGKELIQHGELKKRYTIIPLNKIHYSTYSEERLSLAKKVAEQAGGTVDLAIHYLDYAAENKAAMMHIFGNTLVCDSLNTARKVAFHPKIRTKVVTLDGDLVDPSGVLSGGSQKSGGSILKYQHDLEIATKKMKELEESMRKVTKQIDNACEVEGRVSSLVKKLDKLSTELEVAEVTLRDSIYGQTVAKKTSLEDQLRDMEQEKVTKSSKTVKVEQKIAELKEQLKDQETTRKNMVSQAETDLKQAKKKLATLEKKFSKMQEHHEGNKQEKNRQAEDLESLSLEIKSLEEALEEFTAQRGVAELALEKAKCSHQEVKEILENKKSELGATNSAIGKLSAAYDELEKSKQRKEIELQKHEGRLSRFEVDLKEAKKALRHLVRKYTWIKAEKSMFNKPNGHYDFEKAEMEKVYSKLRKLKDVSSSLSKKINHKVVGMIEKAEKEYSELNNKRKIIEKDRNTIERVMGDLDQKKNQTLFETYQKVNRDFGSIFSTLLRGAHAKLVPDMSVSKKAGKGKRNKKAAQEASTDEDSVASAGERSSDDSECEKKSKKARKRTTAKDRKKATKAANSSDVTEVDGEVFTKEDLLNGLEVKVAFSKGQWKESLSELSGGQRSLLALSLILSFLLFKPAPMYILDEVDAALDLSHTQNIGLMLRKHFKQSQFIVVSLKEGMFNNANVIFRTKFVDGVSTVRRTLGIAQHSKESMDQTVASVTDSETDEVEDKENAAPNQPTRVPRKRRKAKK